MKKSILEVICETAKGLYDAELMDIKTMHGFDAICLPHKFTSKQITHIHLRDKASQLREATLSKRDFLVSKPFKLLRQKMPKSAQKAARARAQHLLKNQNSN